MNGFLLVDKPEGMSSHGVVAKVRKITGIRKVGHTGTLDPMATGLLPICIGQATRMSEYMLSYDKIYRGTLQLGVVSDTYDRMGEIRRKKEPDVNRETVEKVFAAFEGKQRQLPPMYSAKKVGGKKLYELAREGIEIAREPSSVTVFSLVLDSFSENRADFSAHVSKGTYIRSLVHDIGQELSCGAILTALRRMQTGPFSVTDSLSIERMERMEKEKLLSHILPPDQAISHVSSITVDAETARRLGHGQRIPTEQNENSLVRVYGPHGFIGPGEIRNGAIKMIKVLEQNR